MMVRRISSPTILTLTLYLAAGCSVDESQTGVGFQVDTLPSGLVEVRNDGSGQWTSETAWTLEEDLRLGSQDEEGPELFSQVAFILTDDEGRIFILDFPSQEIRVFSSSGEFSHRIGARGEGPGELTAAAGLDWGPEGNLWVWGRRYSVFDPSGQFVTSYPRRVSGVIYPWIGGFVPDGRYIDWGLDREVTGRSQVGQFLTQTYSGATTLSPIAFTQPDRLDSLPILEFRAEVTESGELKTPPKGLMVAQADDGHLWFAHTDEYRVLKRTLDGDTLLAFSIPSHPSVVPGHEIDSIVAASAAAGRPLERARFAEHRRLVTRVLTDNAGYIYVLPEEEDVAEGSVIDVFRTSGVYLGRLNLPESVLTRGPPPYVTTTHLFAVVTNEFDVPYVVRYRINKPGAEQPAF